MLESGQISEDEITPLRTDVAYEWENQALCCVGLLGGGEQRNLSSTSQTLSLSWRVCWGSCSDHSSKACSLQVIRPKSQMGQCAQNFLGCQVSC